MRKNLEVIEIQRIIKIYKEFKINCFPKIKDYNIKKRKPFIDFEWIEGSAIDDDKLPDAFYQLGAIHKQNKIAEREAGFTTICHGDFHKKNIIQNNKGIFFVDVTYIHMGWNYSDLCYLDLYDLFPQEKYPWYIKQPGCFESYLKGLEVNYNKQTEDFIKKKITKYMLNFNISNGIKNGINVDFEKALLKNLNK